MQSGDFTETAAMKMVTDMERIGDHAADISEMTILMGQNSCIDKFNHISEMASETMIMLNHSIEAYVEKDDLHKAGVFSDDDFEIAINPLRKVKPKEEINEKEQKNKKSDRWIIRK